MLNVASAVVRSPLGWIGIAATARGLTRVTVPRPTRSGASASLGRRADSSAAATGHIEATVRGLDDYFATGDFSVLARVPVDLRGTPFELEVWRAVRAIPVGQVSTYGRIARLLGRPQAARAVGLCNARNPLAIVIPCHRVVGSDGSLRGYEGGVEIKKRLLELEGINLKALRAKMLVGTRRHLINAVAAL